MSLPTGSASWTWRCHFTDGTTLDEYDADGREHGFILEVERTERLAVCCRVELRSRRPDVLPDHEVRVDCAAGQRAFLRRIHATAADMGTLRPMGDPGTLVVLGWKRELPDGTTREHYTGWYDDDGEQVEGDDYLTLYRGVVERTRVRFLADADADS